MNNNSSRTKLRDEVYTQMMVAQARLSKDQNTQMGAVLVSADGRVISTGYNGAPAGFDDETVPYTREKQKLAYDLLDADTGELLSPQWKLNLPSLPLFPDTFLQYGLPDGGFFLLKFVLPLLFFLYLLPEALSNIILLPSLLMAAEMSAIRQQKEKHPLPAVQRRPVHHFRSGGQVHH